MKTGFRAYQSYLSLKYGHFKENEYNIMNGLIKKENFINKWNKERKDQDGRLFYEIEKQTKNIHTLIRVYAAYFIHNQNFYVKEILDDNYRKFNKNEVELQNLKDCVSNDFITLISICQKNELKARDMFRSNSESLPAIFKHKNKISVNSFVVFDKVFKIKKHIDSIELNAIEKMKWKDMRIILEKYPLIIQLELKQIDWKEFIKTLL
jgi:hypothetical protein